MNPEDFSRFFGGAFDDQSGDADQSSLRAYFLVAVIERLRASSVAAPAHFFQYLKRLETEPEVESSFTLDLFRLLGDEDGFEWPVDDLGRCLARGVFREHTKERLSSQEPEPETLDDTDGADRWKSE